MNIAIKEKTKIRSSCDLEKLFRVIFETVPDEDKHKEMFYAVGLNSQNTVLYVDLVTMGTVNRASPFVRECLRQAILKNAVNLVVCHNHPSGEVTPSPQDRQFTRDLKTACNLVQLRLLDHIILGDTYYSFADGGGLI